MIIDDLGSQPHQRIKKTVYKKAFSALSEHGAKCLRQTEYAFLRPPKLRTKGHFQSISKLGRWGMKMLDCTEYKEWNNGSNRFRSLLTAVKVLILE